VHPARQGHHHRLLRPADCGPCPARPLCTKGSRRQLSLPPRGLASVQAAAAAQDTADFRAGYARRARLDHIYMACALNLLRLHAYWTGTPLDRRRTSWPSPRLQSPERANLCSPLTSRADNEERAESAGRFDEINYKLN
jgi:hypothetical protein